MNVVTVTLIALYRNRIKLRGHFIAPYQIVKFVYRSSPSQAGVESHPPAERAQDKRAVTWPHVTSCDLMWLSNTDISPQLTYNAQKDRSMHRMKMNIGELSLPVKSVELHTITLASSASVIKHTRGLRWFELNSVILICSQIAWLMISTHSYFAIWNLKHRWLIKPCKVIAKVTQQHILHTLVRRLPLYLLTNTCWEKGGASHIFFFFIYLEFLQWPMATADMTDKIKMSSLPFLQLSQTYGRPKTHFFSYLQIRSFVQKTFISFPDKPTKTQYDCILELNSDHKGLISQVYVFISNINPHSTAHLKRAWDTDLGVDLTEDQWDYIRPDTHIIYIRSTWLNTDESGTQSPLNQC